MPGWITVARQATATFTDRKSEFIADVKPVKTEEEALAFLEEIKKKTADARHHVYAYILQENGTVRFSDDGEPHGTAGMPVLTLLRKAELSDVVLVVTRYFGGILLGTGGLVRAYTESARLALESAGRVSVEELARCKVVCPYGDYSKLESVLSGYRVRKDEQLFETDVTTVFLIPSADAEKAAGELTEATNGRVGTDIECTLYGTV
ncbi:MAG: YigZ family protein [Clostridia bacterium]|nr:YigZ family protein [Clostridia bacterium]